MRKIHPFWGAAAGVFVLAGLVLCVLGVLRGPLLVNTGQSPGRSVSAFFDALSAGELETAYGYLSNCRSLGLENEPQTEDGALLLAALRDNCRCSLMGEATERGTTALQPIRIRFLDLDALEERVLSGEAADIRQALEAEEALTSEADLTLTLCFEEGAWKIVADQALMDALQGHFPGKGAL